MKACPICNDTGPWPSTGDRLAHIRGHHAQTCPDCGATVNSPGALAAHQRYLCGDPPLEPAAPDRRDARQPGAPGPVEVVVNLPGDGQYHRCPEDGCNRLFVSTQGLGRHRLLTHGTPGTSYESQLRRARANPPDPPDTSWMADGNCVGVDPDLFFPERGESTKEAKAVCRACDVRDQCLEFALDNRERFGIWGGLSERERRRIRKARRQRPATFVPSPGSAA
jgi:WhiB family redox-sensing transcriptional regulator